MKKNNIQKIPKAGQAGNGTKPHVASSTVSIETFRKIGSWELSNLTNKEPSCFNRDVSFKKWKVTIEPIEEPIEVYQERLQKLWDECDNHHNWQPLKSAADSIGYTLSGSAGSKRVR